MAALNERSAAVALVHPPGEGGGVALRPAELGGLGQVGRGKRRKRQELPGQRLACIGAKEPGPAGRDHHGVHDTGDLGMRRDPVGDHLYHRGGGEHARLQRADVVDA